VYVPAGNVRVTPRAEMRFVLAVVIADDHVEPAFVEYSNFAVPMAPLVVIFTQKFGYALYTPLAAMIGPVPAVCFIAPIDPVPPKICSVGCPETRPFRATVCPEGAIIAASSKVTWTFEGVVTTAALPTT
jgi:hypothetical protein